MILLIVAWAITSILCFGFLFSYYQNKWPSIAKESKADDYIYCILLSLFPFAGLITVFLLGKNKYGLKFK